MFQESLVESTSLLRSRNRWPAFAAIATQVALLAVLLAVPLIHPEVLPFASPRLSTLAPPPRPTPPRSTPPQPLRAAAVAPGSVAPSLPTTPAPPRFHIAEASPADDPRLAASINLGAANSGPAGLLSSSAPASPHVISGPVGRGLSSNRINVSTGVLAGLLLAPIRPDYPPIARISRTQGTVVIQAIISKSGTIESARILRGPVMLQDAALQAVRSARYHPYLLNNEPTEVETTISINFILNN